MEDLLEGLNRAQREAVTATEGFVRVIAGAGSGKTRALSHRFAFLVNELGILPGNILCVTFTNKSAAEMRQRIHRLTGDDDTGYINTFHGFCVSVLQSRFLRHGCFLSLAGLLFLVRLLSPVQRMSPVRLLSLARILFPAWMFYLAGFPVL